MRSDFDVELDADSVLNFAIICRVDMPSRVKKVLILTADGLKIERNLNTVSISNKT